MRRLDSFVSEQTDKHERNGARAAKLVRRLAESDSWGARPSAPAFETLLSTIVTRDTERIIEVRPLMPARLLVRFPEVDASDPRPTLDALARAFDLADAQVLAVPKGWALQGLPPGVRCTVGERADGRLELVSRITIDRDVPEHPTAPATSQLGIALRGVQRSADLEVLDEMARWFPLRARTATSVALDTGLHWIDAGHLMAALAIPLHPGPPLHFVMPLSRGRQLHGEVYISRTRWIRTLALNIVTA